MTLRKKTLLLLGLALLGLILALGITSQAIVLDGFAREEGQDMQRNVERVRNALHDESATLAGTTRDWATGDDTYAFMKGANAGYPRSNITDLNFVNNRLNLMAFVDTAGKIVVIRAYDVRHNQPAPVPDGFLAQLAPGSRLLQHPDPQSTVTGLLALPGGLLLLSAQPILTSQQVGPMAGTLVFGRWLDVDEIDRLSRETRSTLHSYRPDDPGLPAGVWPALAALPAGNAIFVAPLDNSTEAGYMLLPDIYGRPALVLQLTMARDGYTLGQDTVVYYITVSMVVAILFGLLTLLLLEKLVLRRMSRLSAAVTRIAAGGDLSARVVVGGHDELAALGASINGMLATIEQHLAARRRLEEELAHQAFHDSLTGLPNRALFLDRLGHALARASRGAAAPGVLFLDLDNFKDVNDRLGHAAGDQLLRQVSQRLVQCARRGDTVARLGGDEFTLLLENMSDQSEETRVVERIREQLALPFLLDGQEMVIRISIGVALRTSNNDRPDDLLRNADLAMYEAKQRAKTQLS